MIILITMISSLYMYVFTCVVAVDDRLLPNAEVLALLVDEFHGIVEAPVAHGDCPHGAGLEDDSELGVGLTVGGKGSNLRYNHQYYSYSEFSVGS